MAVGFLSLSSGLEAGQRRSVWLQGDTVKRVLDGTCDGNSSKVKRLYLILVKRHYLRDLEWLIGNSTVERNSLQIWSGCSSVNAGSDIGSILSILKDHAEPSPQHLLFLWSLFEGVPKFYRDC